MKPRIIFLTFLLVLTSCSTNPIENSESDKIAVDMTSFNTRMGGYLFRKQMQNDMSALTEEKYLQLVKTQGNSSEREYINFILDEQPEISISAFKDDFVVCIRLVIKKFGICDKASTNFVDKYIETNELSIDLKKISISIAQ